MPVTSWPCTRLQHYHCNHFWIFARPPQISSSLMTDPIHINGGPVGTMPPSGCHRWCRIFSPITCRRTTHAEGHFFLLYVSKLFSEPWYAFPANLLIHCPFLTPLLECRNNCRGRPAGGTLTKPFLGVPSLLPFHVHFISAGQRITVDQFSMSTLINNIRSNNK